MNLYRLFNHLSSGYEILSDDTPETKKFGMRMRENKKNGNKRQKRRRK